MKPETGIPASLVEKSGPGTVETGSDRGTGVREAHARPQGSLPVEEGP